MTKIEQFKNVQCEIDALIKTLPEKLNTFDYVKRVHFKQTILVSRKFLKMRPTDVESTFIKLENNLRHLRKFYS